MSFLNTPQNVLIPPFSRDLGGITAKYESNQMTGGKKRRLRRKKTAYKKTASKKPKSKTVKKKRFGLF